MLRTYCDCFSNNAEVVAYNYLAFTRKSIKEEEYKNLYNEYELLCKMITKLRDTI